MKRPSPPSHLTPDAASWWRDVTKAWDLDPHHLRLLQAASEAWDRMQDARRAIAKHGAVFEDRFGQPRARPEVGIERDARIAFARLIRELALDVNEPASSRPPAIAGRANLKIGGA
jgi:phage terminase small subunit